MEPDQTKRQSKVKPIAFREGIRTRKIIRVLLVFLGVVVAFVLGFAVRSQSAFISSLGIPVGDHEDPALTQTSNANSTYDSIGSRVQEVEDILEQYSFDTYDLPVATTSMLTDLMNSTGDPYAAYYDSERFNNYIRDTADRSYAGIGVLFAEYNGRAYAVDVFPGSEAQAKGVQQGDYVVAIDGERNRTWSMTEVVNAVAKDVGATVVITWMRPTSLDAQTGQEFTTTLTCQAFDVTNVSTQLDGDVGYIDLRQFTQDASMLVNQAITELTNQGAQAFVLDIRNNPGGYLTQAVDVASLFLTSGIIVEIETKDGTTNRSSTGLPATTAPLVVLVNGYTAASAEVLAAALEDNQRAQLVGTTTQGKGSVQVMRELSFGGAVRYTAAYYLTPLGHQINGDGVTPNITVENTGDTDTQLNVAMETARSLIGG